MEAAGVIASLGRTHASRRCAVGWARSTVRHGGCGQAKIRWCARADRAPGAPQGSPELETQHGLQLRGVLMPLPSPEQLTLTDPRDRESRMALVLPTAAIHLSSGAGYSFGQLTEPDLFASASH
jgi:hypothetical protein